MALVRENVDAFGTGGPFKGFADADFNAYEPKKWPSNAYTLERRRAKDKLLALVRSAQEKLGKELAGLELHGSDEAPTVSNGRKVEAQWAFFTRDADARTSLKPFLQTTNLQAGANLFDIALQHQHACLAVRLDLAGIAVGVELAGKAKVDRENLTEKLKQGWAKEKIAELVRALPPGSTVGGDTERKTADAFAASDLDAWLDLLKSDQRFRVETLVPKTDPAVRAEGLIERIGELLGAHVPLYRFVAWSRDNDHRQVREALKKTVDEKQKRAPAISPGDRVTILAGLFAGRSGYLAEVDAKGRAKVMVGPVSVSVDAKDIKPV